MIESVWGGVASAVAIVALGMVALASLAHLQRRRRRMPTRIGAIRVEAFAVQCVEDVVVERVWRIPLLLSNQGRRPALVPPLAARSEIRTERRTFVASTSLDCNLAELNPGSELIGWVDCVLPADKVPQRLTLTMIGADCRRTSLVQRLTVDSGEGRDLLARAGNRLAYLTPEAWPRTALAAMRTALLRIGIARMNARTPAAEPRIAVAASGPRRRG